MHGVHFCWVRRIHLIHMFQGYKGVWDLFKKHMRGQGLGLKVQSKNLNTSGLGFKAMYARS